MFLLTCLDQYQLVLQSCLHELAVYMLVNLLTELLLRWCYSVAIGNTKSQSIVKLSAIWRADDMLQFSQHICIAALLADPKDTHSALWLQLYSICVCHKSSWTRHSIYYLQICRTADPTEF